MIDAKRKAIIFLTLAFLLAIAAAGVILVQINEAQSRLGETVKVAAAKGTITSYHEIDVEADIQWVDLPASSAYESFISEENELEDSISVVELQEGEILTKSLIRKKLDIPADERVVWLNATEIVKIDQDITEGDLIDIVVVHTDEADKIQTKRMFSNIPVVEVDQVEDSNGEASIPKVKIALSIEGAEQVIHQQNTAVQVRVLRVNQAS